MLHLFSDTRTWLSPADSGNHALVQCRSSAGPALDQCIVTFKGWVKLGIWHAWAHPWARHPRRRIMGMRMAQGLTVVCCADKCHNPTKCHSPRQMSQQPSTNVTAKDKCHNVASTNVTANDKCHNFASTNVTANNKCHNFASTNVTANDKCHNFASTNVTANDKCHNFASTNVTANDKCHAKTMITNSKCHNLPTNVSCHYHFDRLNHSFIGRM